MSLAVRRAWFGALAMLFFVLAPVAAQTTSPKEDDLLEQTRRRNEVAAQRLEADIRKALKEAERLVTTDSTKAIDLLKKSLTGLEDDTALAEKRRDALKRMLKDRIRVTELVAKGLDIDAAEQADKKARETDRQSQEAKRTAEAEKTADELKAIRRLQEDGKSEEAARKAANLAERKPDVPAAGAANRTTTTADKIIEARRLAAERDRRTVGVIRDVERSAMPPAGDIEFPKDWAEKTKKREVVRMTEKERAIMNALNAPVTVAFKGSAFQDVIEYLQTITGQPIVVDKQALDELNIGYDTPVTINAKNLTLRTVLRKVLGDLNLGYVIKDQSIQVMSALRAKETMTVRTYYLGDLAAVVDIQLHPVLTGIATLQNVKQIIETIKTTIEPQSWQGASGQGTITFDPRTISLIVKQSAEVHFMLSR